MIKATHNLMHTPRLPLALISAVALLAGASSLAEEADECADCHSGQKEKAAKIEIFETSVHVDLDCDECHTNAESPHDGEDLLPVRCTGCHKDVSKALKASSHDEKLKTHLAAQQKTRGSEKCLACHGKDPHNILAATEASSATNRKNISTTCLTCHREGQVIDIENYADSVHAAAITRGELKAAECVDCHGSHGIDHSGLPVSKVNHTNVPETCAQCHEDEHKAFIESKHWEVAKKGFKEAPVCTDCHGEHGIRGSDDKESPVWVGNITKTCSECHASEKLVAKFDVAPARVESFEGSFHGLSEELGDVRVANCASCHGNHAILPSSDPRSSVHPSNLGRTCGRCHPGAEKQFSEMKIHTTEERPSHWIVEMVRQFYILLILGTIGGMLTHNILDLACKSIRGMPYHRHEELVPRFSVAERIQHAFLVISFVLLAVSGFALKFPHSPFSWLFQWLSEGPYLRRGLHRVAAAVFFGVGLYHAFYVVFTSRGRKQLALMLPRFHDVLDVTNVAKRYFRRFEAPLKLRHFTYVEKAEYWALVWGTVVMTLTGLVLYFVNTAIANLPLWTIDLAMTIHYWEALLACLAIIVWHGYWVVLDPEYYPLNLTWLLGDPRPRKDGVEKEEHK